MNQPYHKLTVHHIETIHRVFQVKLTNEVMSLDAGGNCIIDIYKTTDDRRVSITEDSAMLWTSMNDWINTPKECPHFFWDEYYERKHNRETLHVTTTQQ